MFFKKRLSLLNKLIIFVISVFLVCSTVTGFIVLPQFFYYGSLGIVGVWMFANGGRAHFSMPLIALFLIFCALSLIVNQPPSYFRAWGRLAGFAMVVLIMSPMITSFKMSLFRQHLLNVIMWMLVALSVGSFFCYFLGINFFIRNDEILAIAAGHFSGLYSHSMLLGPCAALSSIFIFSYFLNERKRWQLYILLCCLGSTFLAASRAALAGCLIGLIVSYLRIFRGQISKAVIVGLSICIIIVASFPIWGGVTDFVLEKQAANIERGGAFNSREGIWNRRMVEIKEHPILGVGFCCVDERYTYVNKSTGVIEPGSSWLAIFSMTGFVGFITILALFYKVFVRTWNNPFKDESCLFSGFLAFYAVHLVFEGYLLAVGSVMGMMFWLILSCAWNSYTYNRLNH